MSVIEGQVAWIIVVLRAVRRAPYIREAPWPAALDLTIACLGQLFAAAPTVSAICASRAPIGLN